MRSKSNPKPLCYLISVNSNKENKGKLFCHTKKKGTIINQRNRDTLGLGLQKWNVNYTQWWKVTTVWLSGMTDLPTVTYMEEHQTLHLSAGGTTRATSRVGGGGN